MLIFCVMTIDFHTHYYPPCLARRALRGVDDVVEGDADGTLAGLENAMRGAGVDLAVALPVCGRPGHERTVNDFVLNTHGNGIIPFFSVHPHSENAPALVREYADKGLKGVKFHPNMQNFVLGDPCLVPLWRAVRDAGITAVFHCGRPGRTPTDLDVYPSDFLPLFDILCPERTVLAHTGGYGITDKELAVLAGCGAYADLSLASSQFTPERFCHVLSVLRADKLLFGSDSPWRDIRANLDFVRSAVRDKRALDMILHANAEKLLFGAE